MRTQPNHHDGEGTDASLHAFLNDVGVTPAPTIIGIDNARASRDIGFTVRRMRARGIEPPHVDGLAPSRSNTAILLVANALILWVAIALIRAWLAGRI